MMHSMQVRVYLNAEAFSASDNYSLLNSCLHGLDKTFSQTCIGYTAIGVNSYWAQGLKPPPHIYDQGARLYDEPPTFVT